MTDRERLMMAIIDIYETMARRANDIRILTDRCAGEYADSNDFERLRRLDTDQDGDDARLFVLRNTLGR